VAKFLVFLKQKPKTKETMTHYSPDQSGEKLQLHTLLSVFSRSSLRGKSRVQLIAIGLPEDVLQLMYRLHRCGLEVPLWSPPQPIPDTDEIVRVYIQNAGQNAGQNAE
jgi:hypothetical protein